MSKNTKLAEIFYKARLRKDLTQAALAKEANVYPNTYAKIERGEQKPSIPTMKKLAKVLDLDLSELLKVWS
jgi:transcriptional regulator with XRE-family HTH domain